MMDFLASLDTLWFYRIAVAVLLATQASLMFIISRKDEQERKEGYEAGHRDGYVTGHCDGFDFAGNHPLSVPAKIDISLSLDASALINAVQTTEKSIRRYAPEGDDQAKKEAKPK